MASPGVMVEEQRYRPPESKSSKSPKSRGSSLKHKTRFPASAVKESEQSLNQLLEDFEGGDSMPLVSFMLQKKKMASLLGV